MLYQIQLVQNLKRSTDYAVAVEFVGQCCRKSSTAKEPSELLFFTVPQFKKLQSQIRAYEKTVDNQPLLSLKTDNIIKEIEEKYTLQEISSVQATVTDASIQFEAAMLHPQKMLANVIISSETNTCMVLNVYNKMLKQFSLS